MLKFIHRQSISLICTALLGIMAERPVFAAPSSPVSLDFEAMRNSDFSAIQGANSADTRETISTDTFDAAQSSETWAGGGVMDRRVKCPLQFLGLALEHSALAPVAGRHFLDNITIHVNESQSDVSHSQVHSLEQPSTLVSVQCDQVLPVYGLGHPITISASVTSHGDDRNPFQIRWKVSDLYSDPVAHAVQAIPNRKRFFLSRFRFRPSQPGIFYVHCEIVDRKNIVLKTAETRVVVFTHPGVPHSVLPLLYGVCAHGNRYPTAEAVKEIEMMRAGGFGACRFDFDWFDVQPQRKGLFEWSRYDPLFHAFAVNQIVPLPLMSGTPQWAKTGSAASPQGNQWGIPPQTSAYLEFLRQSVRRYHRGTPCWEIWNEPDLTSWLGTAQEYGALLGASVRAIHQTDPQALVMNGGVSEVDSFRPGFVSAFLESTHPRPDVFAYHSHMSLSNLVIARNKIDADLSHANSPHLPVWLNESGIPTVGTITELDQAITLIKKMTYAPTRGDRAFLAYDIRNDGVDPSNAEDNYGLIRHDFSPKAAYAAIHTLISELTGKRYQSSLSVGPHFTAYVYRQPTQVEVVAWADLPTERKPAYLLKTSARAATEIDLMGRQQRLKIIHGLLVCPISSEPHFLRLDGHAVTLKAVANPLQTPEAVRHASAAGKFTVTVKNPFATPLRGMLRITADSARIAPNAVALDVSPGMSRPVVLHYQVHGSQAKSSLVHVKLLMNGSFPAIVNDLTLQPALVVPSAPSADGPWDGKYLMQTLTTASNLVSLYAATPITELQFHGDSDLSAKVSMRRTPQGIMFRVVVTDDLHCQTESGDQMWQGDSVQIGIAPPGGNKSYEKSYEWTGALTPAGPRLHWDNPPPPAIARTHHETFEAQRIGDQTIYTLTVPSAFPGIAECLQQGCGVDVLVNDNDGTKRKGWIEWTPGIGMTKDPAAFAQVLFQSRPKNPQKKWDKT